MGIFQFSNVDSRFAIGPAETGQSNSEILNRSSLYHRVPPGERDLTSSDGDPGTNGVISKTRCGGWIKLGSGILQAAAWLSTALTFISLTPVFRPVLLPRLYLKAVLTAFTTLANEAVKTAIGARLV